MHNTSNHCFQATPRKARLKHTFGKERRMKIVHYLLLAFVCCVVGCSTQRQFEKFIREADTVEYRNRNITGGRQPDILLLKDNDQVHKFLGNFKLVAQKMCGCVHSDMLVFRKTDKHPLVSICDHCFDICLEPGVKNFEMQKDLYQRFKALQADHERNKKNTDPE